MLTLCLPCSASQQIQCKDLAEIDMDNVEDTFRTNIIQYIGLTKAALPHLKRGDSIICTTSVTAYKGSAGMLDYSATKGAINTFIRSLAMQVLPKGIRVTGVGAFKSSVREEAGSAVQDPPCSRRKALSFRHACADSLLISTVPGGPEYSTRPSSIAFAACK